MRQVLTNSDGGYYTTRGGVSEIFGTKGDFVTSPEISQIFGELIGIWTVAEWMAQGQVSGGVELIEVGPGKGTLMADLLRVSFCGLQCTYWRRHILISIDDSEF
jgi:NADH dehydrogenase [ubiquinone] 1 alpha subcomplex assembly factor 7